jgi:hypothetical protein
MKRTSKSPSKSPAKQSAIQQKVEAVVASPKTRAAFRSTLDVLYEAAMMPASKRCRARVE